MDIQTKSLIAAHILSTKKWDAIRLAAAVTKQSIYSLSTRYDAVITVKRSHNA